MATIQGDFGETVSTSSSLSSIPNTSAQTRKLVSFQTTPQFEKPRPPSKAISFSERDSLIDSIQWLSRHVPRCVSKDLSNDALRYQNGQDTVLEVPFANTYSAALLFVDMSGFTKLSQMLDLDNLSKNINAYFQKIVDEVTNHGGDILKFAGDAVFAEWRVPKNISNKRLETTEIQRCVYDAAVCGAAIVAKCADFPIFHSTNKKLQIATLNVHCGLAFGNLAGVHVGNDYNRREFLILGKTIELVSKACDAATYGELMASPEAYGILQKVTTQIKIFGVTLQQISKSNNPTLIASQDEIYFQKIKPPMRKVGSSRNSSQKTPKQLSNQKQDFSIPIEKMKLKGLRYLKKMLSLYVHPVVVSDEVTRPVSQRFVKVDQDVHKAEAELRSVYTIFIKALTTFSISDDMGNNREVFLQLNDIFDVVTSVLDGFKGHLRQFIVDDKGVILIATFGLRGSTTPNMASDRVLPASRTIHYALQNDLGVDNYIGTTLGEAYCGVVGGIKRHEYAVLGPPVNLAARLLSMSNHPGILINGDVQKAATTWGSFLSFPPMKAKGYTELVPVYQPLIATEVRWGKVNPVFVGRKEEIKRMCTLAQAMVLQKSPAKMFFVWGESGSGKSDFLVQTTSIMRRLLLATRNNIIIKGNIGNEGNSMVPFSLFRTILSDLLGETDNTQSNQSILVPRRSLFLSICRHLKIKSTVALEKNDLIDEDEDSFVDDVYPQPMWETMSFSSSSSMNTVRKHAAKRLKNICSQIGGSEAMIQIIRYHLGHTQKSAKAEKIACDDVVEFMAKVFLKCTSHADLTVIALDDLHHTDSMSWQVIKKIFETGKNILIICGSRPFGSHAFYGDEFWKNLTSVHRENSRFQELSLGPLSRFDVAKLASLMLDCKVEEVDRKVIKDVFDYTGGMPNYAYQAISNVYKKGLLQRLDSKRFGWGTADTKKETMFPSYDELLLQRIDDLDDFTRKTLHLCSVLGHTFTFMELVAVSEQLLSIPERKRIEHSKSIKSSLKMAIKEDILEERPMDEADTDFRLKHYSRSHVTRSTFRSILHVDDSDDDDDDDDEDMCYIFCHDSWRQKILSLLLDSYKRDIHRYAAQMIKKYTDNIDDSDNQTKMKLFHHLKDSGDSVEAANLALKVALQLADQGLDSYCIHIYNEALGMFRKNSSSDDTETLLIQGFSMDNITSLDKDELLLTLKLLTALGEMYEALNEHENAEIIFKDTFDIYQKASNASKRAVRHFVSTMQDKLS